MRVLLATGIYPPETGGPATFVPALAAEWKARGMEVTIVTYGDERTHLSKEWLVEVVSRAGGVLVRYVRYALRVWRLARRADVVFLQGAFSEGLPGTIGAMLARRPTMLRVPGDFAWEGMQREGVSSAQALEQFLATKKPLKWRAVFAVESWVARRAKAVVTPSRYLQALAVAWKVREERRHVIYNTVRLEQNLPSREVLRRELGIAEGSVVLLVNARGASWKRVDFLLEILRVLPSQYVLVHVGEGPEIAAWKTRAEALGVAERVQWKGRVPYEDAQRWARAADALLLPSLYEGFPHVAIEAACHGTPCFLSDQGGNPEAAEAYPDRIRILPYAHLEAWKTALRTIPAPYASLSPESFSDVAQKYATVIRSAL